VVLGEGCRVLSKASSDTDFLISWVNRSALRAASEVKADVLSCDSKIHLLLIYCGTL
jgi:hypothetical protein